MKNKLKLQYSTVWLSFTYTWWDPAVMVPSHDATFAVHGASAGKTLFILCLHICSLLLFVFHIKQFVLHQVTLINSWFSKLSNVWICTCLRSHHTVVFVKNIKTFSLNECKPAQTTSARRHSFSLLSWTFLHKLNLWTSSTVSRYRAASIELTVCVCVCVCGSEALGSPWALCEPELFCTEPSRYCCQSSEPRHSLWQRLCTASQTGNTVPWKNTRAHTHAYTHTNIRQPV